MTFKDLQKIIQINQQQSTITTKHFDRFQNLPFWIWDQSEHKRQDLETKGNCCFNHLLGLPRNNNDVSKQNPLFDYQQTIFESLQNHRHLWILKSTGLGISEFFLRYMAWLCLRNDDYQNSQMVIVTGPNIDLAIKLIRRMKRLFEPLNIFFDSKETVLELNRVRIESYPSNHIDSFRSLDNPKFILLDEADFFRKSEQEEVRAC